MRVATLLLLLLILSCHKPGAVSSHETEGSTVTNNLSQSRAGRPRTDIQAGNKLGSGELVHYVRPEYPESLRRKHVQGIVHLRVSVAADGVPTKIIYINGPKELVEYAESAVKRWRYRPPVINGQPIAFVTDALVQFTLSQ